jgi:hypothetical protein
VSYIVSVVLVVQILRLVPADSAGQTAGIDPKRKIVATDSMSRIDTTRRPYPSGVDVKRTLRMSSTEIAVGG